MATTSSYPLGGVTDHMYTFSDEVTAVPRSPTENVNVIYSTFVKQQSVYVA